MSHKFPKSSLIISSRFAQRVVCYDRTVLHKSMIMVTDCRLIFTLFTSILLVVVRELDPGRETFPPVNVQTDPLYPDVLVEDRSAEY